MGHNLHGPHPVYLACCMLDILYGSHRMQEGLADMLGVTRLEPDGPPTPLYPPGKSPNSSRPAAASLT